MKLDKDHHPVVEAEKPTNSTLHLLSRDTLTI